MPVYYKNKLTNKFEAKYVNCDTNSAKFRDETIYVRLELEEDFPLPEIPIKHESISLFLNSPNKRWEISVSDTGRLNIQEVI